MSLQYVCLPRHLDKSGQAESLSKTAGRVSSQPAVCTEGECTSPDQCADNATDDSADNGRNRRDASGVMDDDRTRRRAVVMVMVDVMTGRRRRRAVMSPGRRTVTPVMRRGNRRARGKGETRNENHDCLDDLVHITPATFCFVGFAGARPPLTERQEPSPKVSDKVFTARPCQNRSTQIESPPRHRGAHILQYVRGARQKSHTAPPAAPALHCDSPHASSPKE